MAAATHFDTVQKIYIAFYQRPADPAGLKYWAERIDQAGGDAQAVVSAFATSPEAVALYGTIDDTTIGSVIDKIYDALFNTTPDDAGKKFYVDGFKAGTFTAGTIALNVLNGAAGDDAVAIANKLQVSNEFTQQIDGRPLNDPYFGAGTKFNVTYAGDADAQAARDLLKTVTFSPASVLDPAEVTAQIIAKIADPTDPIVNKGSAFTLTTGADMATANLFDAPTVVTQVGAQVDTLQSTDKLTGTGDNPTLNAVLSTAVVATPTMSGIETINVMAEGAARTLNLSKATGVKAINANNSQQSLSVLGVQSNAAIGVTNGDGVADTLVRFADSVTSGTSDVAKVILTSNGNANVASGQTINLSGTTSSGFETLEITAIGANRINAILSDATDALGVSAGAANAVRTVKVDGEGSLRIETALTSTTTFDASANKGGVNVALNNAGAITVTGGEGNDTFNVAGNLTNADKIDGGAGRNTLTTTNGITVGHQLSNIQILRNDGAAAGTVFDNDTLTSVDTIVHNSANTATYQDMVGANAADSAKGLTLQGVGVATFNIKNASGLGGNADAIYAKVGSAAGTTGVNAAGGAIASLTTVGTEKVTLDVAANVVAANTATGVNLIGDAATASVALNGGAANQAFVLTIAGLTGAAMTSVDASGFVGNLAGAALGAGNPNGVGISGNAFSQVIKAGGGSDVISTGGRAVFTGLEFADVMTGGAGADVFVFDADTVTAATSTDTTITGALLTANAAAIAANGYAQIATITDLNLGGAVAGSNVDTINFAAGGVHGAAVANSLGSVAAGGFTVVNGGAATALTGADLGAALNTLVQAGGVLGNLGAGVAGAGLFTWGGETFIVATTNIAVNDAFGAATALGQDIIIKVTGVTGTLDASDFV